jgi:hypothetical protein
MHSPTNNICLVVKMLYAGEAEIDRPTGCIKEEAGGLCSEKEEDRLGEGNKEIATP